MIGNKKWWPKSHVETGSPQTQCLQECRPPAINNLSVVCSFIYPNMSSHQSIQNAENSWVKNKSTWEIIQLLLNCGKYVLEFKIYISKIVVYIDTYIWIGCNNDIWVWRILFHKVDKVKIQILEFSKWKFEIQYFRSVEVFARLIEMIRKSILKSLSISINARFLFYRSKRAFDWLRFIKLYFLQNFQ